MITAISVELLKLKLEKAIEKAASKNPEIKIIEFGLYEVKGSKGNWYQVRAGRTADNQFYVACQCPGALHAGYCYHSGAAYLAHKKEAQRLIDKKQRSEMDNAPYLQMDTGKKLEKMAGVRY